MAILKSETIHNVTAYADACLGGYVGTYEQWCYDLAHLGGSQMIIPVDPDPEPTIDGAVWITTIPDTGA